MSDDVRPAPTPTRGRARRAHRPRRRRRADPQPDPLGRPAGAAGDGARRVRRPARRREAAGPARQARPRLVGEAAHRAREDHRHRARRRSGCARRTPSSTRSSTARRPRTAYAGWWRTSTRRVVDARRQLTGGPPVVTPTRDVEAEVEAWRERREDRRGPRRRRSRRSRRPRAPPFTAGDPPSPLIPPNAAELRDELVADRASRNQQNRHGQRPWSRPGASSRVGVRLLHRDPDAALGGGLLGRLGSPRRRAGSRPCRGRW